MPHTKPVIYTLAEKPEEVKKMNQFVEEFQNEWDKKKIRVVDVKNPEDKKDRVLPALSHIVNYEKISPYWSGWYATNGIRYPRPKSGPIILVTDKPWSINYNYSDDIVKPWFYISNLIPRETLIYGELLVATISTPNFENTSPKKCGKFTAKYLKDAIKKRK